MVDLNALVLILGTSFVPWLQSFRSCFPCTNRGSLLYGRGHYRRSYLILGREIEMVKSATILSAAFAEVMIGPP